MLGFFGAAGLTIERISTAIDRIQRTLGELPYGFNLINSPHEPRHEAETVDLYLRRGVRLISAAAYLDLSEPLVRYRITDIHRDGQGRVIAPNRVIREGVAGGGGAKVFLAPAGSDGAFAAGQGPDLDRASGTGRANPDG